MIKSAESLHVKIEQYVRKLIFDGTTKVGDLIPSEREIAKLFHASKIPVRQATQKLVDMGVLLRVAGKGTFIRSLMEPEAACNRIGVLYPHEDTGFFSSSYYAAIISGIEMQAKREGKSLLFKSLLAYRQDNPSRVLHELLDQVDGFIVVDMFPTIYERLEGTLTGIKKPLVVVNYEGLPDAIDAMVTDSWEKTEKMLNFLIGLGHRTIACLHATVGPGDNNVHPAVVNRINAYKQTLAAQDLPINNEIIVPEINPYVLKAMMERHKPTAFFCTSDYQALELYQAARQAGVRVPDDISVVGYGGIPESETVSPALTTIKVPALGMGAAAVRRIIERQKEGEAGTGVANYRMVFPGTLIQRESHRGV
jgi:DNA-binding LacI/PurR family transcriptional regulator